MLRDVEIVLDEVGSARATLLGLWDGCNTSILFAATNPERVASLILFSASATQKPAEDYPWAWTDEKWEEWLASIRNGWGTRPWVVKNARWMGPGMLDSPDEIEQWITYTRVAASPSSAEAVMRNSSETDIREILPMVQTPTLVLHRVGDQVEPIEAGRYVAAKMPNARLVELQGTTESHGSGTPTRCCARFGRSSVAAFGVCPPAVGSPQSCSRISWDQPSAQLWWETPDGQSSWKSTIGASGTNSAGSRVLRSTRPATAS